MDILKHWTDNVINTKIKLAAADGKEAQPVTGYEMLASYVDSVMQLDIVDPQKELQHIEYLAPLLTYMKEKDVFQEYHQAMLAKRLLLKRDTASAEQMCDTFIRKYEKREWVQYPLADFPRHLKAQGEGLPKRKLRAMYVRFRIVPPALDVMANTTYKQICTEGKRILQDVTTCDLSQAPTCFVKGILDTHKKYSQLFIDIFSNDARFINVLKHWTDNVINTKIKLAAADGKEAQPVTGYEMLASYVDSVMQLDNVDPQEELKHIEYLAPLLTYMKEKDVFQEYHHQAKLAKRLLQPKPNLELEKAFVEKLQRVMGERFTHKMKGMLRDCWSMRDVSDKFRDEASRDLPIDLTCQVLAAGHWPAYCPDALAPSAALRQSMEAFTRFYRCSHANHTLSWIHMLGSATVSIAFPKGVKDVTCSIHQATILVLIDEAGEDDCAVAFCRDES